MHALFDTVVLMVASDFHFTEHTARRLGLPFYTRTGVPPPKKIKKLDIVLDFSNVSICN